MYSKVADDFHYGARKIFLNLRARDTRPNRKEPGRTADVAAGASSAVVCQAVFDAQRRRALQVR